MITFNVLNVFFLFLGGLAIWGILPDQYKGELGLVFAIIVEIMWLITWIVIFPVLGYQITVS